MATKKRPTKKPQQKPHYVPEEIIVASLYQFFLKYAPAGLLDQTTVYTPEQWHRASGYVADTPGSAAVITSYGEARYFLSGELVQLPGFHVATMRKEFDALLHALGCHYDKDDTDTWVVLYNKPKRRRSPRRR